MGLPEDEEKRSQVSLWIAWRLEYILLLFVVVLLTVFAFVFFFLQIELSRLRDYGYLGVFIANLIGAASLILPTPAAATVVGGGAVLNSFLGIPTFVLVGIVAGFGEAIGEFTGYAAGYGGRVMIEERPQYQIIKRWMERHGVITMFVLAAIPNPFIDIAGAAAGAVRMPLGRFFLAVLAGKIVKDMMIAAVGDFSSEILGGILGLQ